MKSERLPSASKWDPVLVWSIKDIKVGFEKGYRYRFGLVFFFPFVFNDRAHERHSISSHGHKGKKVCVFACERNLTIASQVTSQSSIVLSPQSSCYFVFNLVDFFIFTFSNLPSLDFPPRKCEPKPYYLNTLPCSMSCFKY